MGWVIAGIALLFALFAWELCAKSGEFRDLEDEQQERELPAHSIS